MSFARSAARLRHALVQQGGFTRSPTCPCCGVAWTPATDAHGVPLPVTPDTPCPACQSAGLPVAGGA